MTRIRFIDTRAEKYRIWVHVEVRYGKRKKQWIPVIQVPLRYLAKKILLGENWTFTFKGKPQIGGM